MATGNINLSVLGKVFTKSKAYTNIFDNSYEVDNTDGFIDILLI